MLNLPWQQICPLGSVTSPPPPVYQKRGCMAIVTDVRINAC